MCFWPISPHFPRSRSRLGKGHNPPQTQLTRRLRPPPTQLKTSAWTCRLCKAGNRTSCILDVERSEIPWPSQYDKCDSGQADHTFADLIVDLGGPRRSSFPIPCTQPRFEGALSALPPAKYFSLERRLSETVRNTSDVTIKFRCQQAAL